ncbi:MAG: hypothetical protein U0836_00210 [Pirellulales bacterium]
MPQPRPIADIPWFWAMVFCSVALIGILTVGPKFTRRQAQLERRAEVRERIAYGQPVKEIVTTHAPPSPFRRLAPLAAVVGAGWIVSWVMMQREIRRNWLANGSSGGGSGS